MPAEVTKSQVGRLGAYDRRRVQPRAAQCGGFCGGGCGPVIANSLRSFAGSGRHGWGLWEAGAGIGLRSRRGRRSHGGVSS